MKYKLLGNSGLRVSEICLGAMTFGTEWGAGGDKEQSIGQFSLFLERGGNFIDTANRYTEGTSELFLGEFMQGIRENLVIATKFSLYTKKGNILDGGNSRKNMVQSLEGSLKRLNTDYVDILYLHMWDFTTPAEEVMRALDDLVSAGKVLYVGISDTPAWIISRANVMAELKGWSKFIVTQDEYNLITRDIERDILPMAEMTGMGVAAWAPIAGGALSGKYLNTHPEGTRLKPESKRLTERAVAVTKEVLAVAAEAGCTPVQVAINWLLKRSKVVIPIIGARTIEQLKDSLDCLNHTLSDEHYNRLEKVSSFEHGFPNDFLKTELVRELLFGGKFALLEEFSPRF